MNNRILILVTCILGLAIMLVVMLGAMLDGILGQAWFPDRTKPNLHVSVTPWQSGKVGFCDYSTYPGTYNWKLEYHSDDGKRRTLMVLGDVSTPSCKVMSDGSLSVLHQDALRVREGDMLPVVTTFATPFLEPVKGSTARQNSNSEQPATKPVDKAPEKVQPLTPTSKDGPR